MLVVGIAEAELATPPVGLNVFVVARYTKRPLGKIFSGITPHAAAPLVLVALMVIFPQTILWPPSTMRRRLGPNQGQ